MTISYTFDRKTVATGLSRSMSHRTPIRRFLIPALGTVFLAASLKYLLLDESERWELGVALFILGAVYLVLPIHRRRRTVENVFAGRSDALTMQIKPLEEGLEMSSAGSSGTASWSSFVDFRICKDGILLYPQKMIHYWIPHTASVEGGTWRDFEALVSGKIRRRI